MISYSISAAAQSGIFDRIIVSTDDEEIAEIAKAHGAEVPFIRPAEISCGESTMGQVVDHAIGWLKDQGCDVEYVCMVFATAPLLRYEHLKASFERMEANEEYVGCMAVSQFHYPIQRALKLTEDGTCRFFQPEHFTSRSQDLEPAYHDAAQFVWTALKRPIDENAPIGTGCLAYVLPNYEVVDIDTEDDWIRAEIAFEALKKRQRS